MSSEAELVKASAEGAARALEILGGSALEEGRHWASDTILRRRLKTQIKTAAKAKEWLDEAGLSTTVKPRLDILVPLLSFAELQDEDDEDMHARWAALLANAVAEDGPNEVLPSFPRILSELGPVEAKMLAYLVEAEGSSHLLGLGGFGGDDESRRRTEIEVHVDNLVRLGLVARTQTDTAGLRELEKRIANKFRELDRRSGFRQTATPQPYVWITPLGQAFLRACTPPARSADASPAAPNGQ